MAPIVRSNPEHLIFLIQSADLERPGVTVAWNTYQQLTQACVQYGTAANALSNQACSSSSITYPTSRTWANVVTLGGLTPATKYYYRIVSSNSTADQFLSPRVAGDKTPFQMNAVIDLGVYGRDGFTIDMDMSKRDVIPSISPSLNHTTIGRLAQTINDYEFIVHPGDIGYADDWILKPHNWFDGKDGYQAITEEFFNQLAPISARKPYMASPGNHEASKYCSPMVKTLTLHVLTYGDVSLPGDPPHQPTLSRWPKELYRLHQPLRTQHAHSLPVHLV